MRRSVIKARPDKDVVVALRAALTARDDGRRHPTGARPSARS